jgi:hypothetical protein
MNMLLPGASSPSLILQNHVSRRHLSSRCKMIHHNSSQVRLFTTTSPLLPQDHGNLFRSTKSPRYRDPYRIVPRINLIILYDLLSPGATNSPTAESPDGDFDNMVPNGVTTSHNYTVLGTWLAFMPHRSVECHLPPKLGTTL